MRFFLLVCCSVILVALSFVYAKPWLGGLGLLVAFVSMFSDRDPVRLDGRDRHTETPMGVRRMRKQRQR